MPKGIYIHKKGSKRSEESKKRMSLAQKGKIPTMLGKHHSEETKKKMRITKLGKRLSEEHKKKISKSNSGILSSQWKGGLKKNKVYINWQKGKNGRIKRMLNKDNLGHTFGEWELLKIQYGNTCPCCKKSEPEIKLTIDHIIPLSKGGTNLIENIQPLCLKCNMKKHTKIIKYEYSV